MTEIRIRRPMMTAAFFFLDWRLNQFQIFFGSWRSFLSISLVIVE